VTKRYDSMVDRAELPWSIDRLLDHTDSEKDTEDDDNDSGDLIEDVHPFTPENLRTRDEQSVDDELTLRGPRDEHEETDCGN